MNEYYTILDDGSHQCSRCPVLVRTLKGIALHLSVCHGIRIAVPPGNADPDPERAGDIPAYRNGVAR